MEALFEGTLRYHNLAWSQKEVPDVDLMALGLVLVVTGQCHLGILGGQRLSWYRNRSPPEQFMEKKKKTFLRRTWGIS